MSSGLFCVYLWLLPCDFPPRPYSLSVPCFLSSDRFTVYCYFHFFGIPLTLIGMPMLNWFTRNTNVDFGNVIRPSVMFPVNTYVIKYCLKY